ncbi:MAG: DinB family protein [Acidobacteriota bacterium]
MKLVRSLFAAAGLSMAAGLPALSNPATPASALARAIDAEITSQEQQFVPTAEAMPEGRFDYSPESLNLPGTELKGVRTFAMQVKHVAADNFAIWAPLTGRPEPAGLNAPNGPPAMKPRAEILKFLKDSFAFSHAAVRGLTSENALETVEFRGQKVTRMSLVVLALTHMSNHYGQMVEYLRLCGVVPPSSRPMQMSPPPKPAGS